MSLRHIIIMLLVSTAINVTAINVTVFMNINREIIGRKKRKEVV